MTEYCSVDNYCKRCNCKLSIRYCAGLEHCTVFRLTADFATIQHKQQNAKHSGLLRPFDLSQRLVFILLVSSTQHHTKVVNAQISCQKITCLISILLFIIRTCKHTNCQSNKHVVAIT